MILDQKVRIFLRVARAGGFRRAARGLALSQSARRLVDPGPYDASAPARRETSCRSNGKLKWPAAPGHIIDDPAYMGELPIRHLAKELECQVHRARAHPTNRLAEVAELGLQLAKLTSHIFREFDRNEASHDKVLRVGSWS